jgi:O-antigen ligase
MLIEIEICKNALNFLRYLRRLLALLVFANFISILLFPDGFYVTHADSLAIGWFLGYKNSVMAFIMPFICVSLLYAHFTAGRITIGTTVILAISTYSIIHVWSATALVGMFIVLFFVAMIYKHNLSMKFNMHNYLIVVNIIFILIIVLGIQKYFSFLIEQILDKDLTFTGRIYVWEKAKFYISQYPIIGNAGIVSAHNMYLQIFYSGGATAFSVYLTIIYTVSKRLNHRKKSEFVNILSCVIFVYLIMALTESIFGWLFYGMCVLAYHVDRIIEQYTQYVGGETYNVNPSKI